MRCAYLLGSVALLSSCAHRATDSSVESVCEGNESFYVVSHGWHAGIVVDRLDLLDHVPALEKDFPLAAYLEIGWGDEQWYRAQTPSAGLAIRAVLWPTSTVIHAVAIPKSPRLVFPESEVIEVSIPRAGYEQLLTYLAESFKRTSSGGLVPLGRGLYGDGRFYRAEGRFHAFNTCNTWVAKAVGTTGYPIRDQTVITVGPLLRQFHGGINENEPCFSIK